MTFPDTRRRPLTEKEAAALATAVHQLAAEVLVSIKRAELAKTREAVEDLRYGVWRLEDYVIDAAKKQSTA